jgi:hypothetical protein
MTTLSIQPPFPLITDIDGQPLEDGYIWIGVANLPPIGNPIAVYWDAALTQPAALPVRTRGGYPVNAGTPARLYVGSDYSIQVQNKNGSVVYSAPQATERYGALIISSADISFLQAGLGAVTRTAQSKMRDVVSVKDFGAVGNGVADDTVAIRAAIAALPLQSSTSILTEFSRSTLYFPEGVYKITDYLTPDVANSLVYTNVVGENAIISQASGVTAFMGIGTMTSFEYLLFQGGAGAIKISTANIDTSVIRVMNCSFLNYTANCIWLDANSNSTQLTVSGSRFSIPLGATAGLQQVLKAESGDFITFTDCWVSHKSTTTAFDNNGILYLNRICGVPMPDSPGTGPAQLPSWVINRLNVSAKDCRFGGEGGGVSTAIVQNLASSDTSYPVTPTKVEIIDCDVYSTGTVVAFSAIPNIVNVSNNRGLVDTKPLVFNAAIPSADISNIGSINSNFVVENNSAQYTNLVGYDPLTNTGVRESIPRVNDCEFLSARPTLAALQINTQAFTGGFTPTFSNSNITRSNDTNSFGVVGYAYTATSNNASFVQAYTTMLNGISAGVKTAVFDVENNSTFSVRIYFTAGNFQCSEFVIPAGKHTICLPFYYESGVSEKVEVACFGIPNTCVLILRKIRVYAGRVMVSGQTAEFNDSAAPVGGNFYIGDVVYIPPVAGSFLGYVCTTAGAPGTWKTFGAITP